MTKPTQFLITDIASTTLSESEKQWLNLKSLFGILLFSRNFESKEQLIELCQSIKSLNPKLKIMVDYEGGRVQRFKTGFTPIKPMRELGKHFDTDPKSALINAAEIGHIIGKELRAVGMDIDFAPVIDCDFGRENGAIKDRAFHHQPEVVYELAKTWIESLQSQNIKATLKHFPGHGFVELDTHFEFIADQRSLAEINHEMQIYTWLVEDFKTQIEYVMLAHLVYPKVDALPVFLSKKWIDYLRQTIGFKGKIITDDLNMKAAQHFGSILDLTLKSLEVGCDLIILTHNPKATETILNHFSHN